LYQRLKIKEDSEAYEKVWTNLSAKPSSDGWRGAPIFYECCFAADFFILKRLERWSVVTIWAGRLYLAKKLCKALQFASVVVILIFIGPMTSGHLEWMLTMRR